MRLAVHIPAWQRLELLALVLRNLQEVQRRIAPHEIVTVVAGSEGVRSRDVARANDAHYIEVPNQPLGAKVNAAVTECRKYDPDAIVGIGSDDLVCSRVFLTWLELLAQGVEYMGTLDLYCLDLASQRLVYWPGYLTHRKGEAIGVGRCISRRLMDALNWEPFGASNKMNLDASMTSKLAGNECKSQSVLLREMRACIIDIKTSVGINPMPSYGQDVPDAHGLVERAFGQEIAGALWRVQS